MVYTAKFLCMSYLTVMFVFVAQIPEPDASILSISIDREASYMAAVNNQVMNSYSIIFILNNEEKFALV